MRVGLENFDYWTGGTPMFASLNETPTEDTAVKLFGLASAKSRSEKADYSQIAFIADTARTYYCRFGVYIPEAFPTEAASICRLADNTGTFFEISLGSSAQKNLRSFTGGAKTPAAIGANSPEIALSTWYIVEIKIKINPTNEGNAAIAWKVWNADGSAFLAEQSAEIQQATGRNIGLKAFRCGNISPRIMTGLHIDAMQINDDRFGVDNTWIGAGRIEPPEQPKATKCYQGATMDGTVGIEEGTGERGDAPYTGSGITTWDKFEEHSGRKVGVVSYSDPGWTWDGFGAGASARCFERGAIPLKSMGFEAGSLGTATEILEGKKDAVIKVWAEEAAKFGHPFFFRPSWEMNTSAWPWAFGSLEPSTYVEAWQYLYGKIKPIAPNVTFCWCPNVLSRSGGPAVAGAPVDFRPWYPGDGYVDWTGLDGYVGTQAKKNEGWYVPLKLFKVSYDRLREIAPTKPIIVVETAASETGGTKSTWITELLSGLQTNFPGVKGFLWFNNYIEQAAERITWPIESGTPAKEAYKSAIASSYFLAPQASELLEDAPVPLPVAPGGLKSEGLSTRPTKPSLDLTIEIEGLSGQRFRLSADAPARQRYTGLSFSTQRGEGFSTADYQLQRPIFRDYPDVAVLGTQRFIGEDGDVAYEGMLHSNPRNNSSGPVLAMSLVGFAFLLKSRLISPLIIDRRLSGWQAPSTERVAVLAGGNISLVGTAAAKPNNYVVKVGLAGHRPKFEKVGIGSALVDDFTNVTTKPVVTEAGELDFFSGPEDIAELRYDFRSLVGAEEPNWVNQVGFGVESTFQTAPINGTGHKAKTALLQKKAVGALGYRYARVADWFNVASENLALTRIFAWGNVRVIGTHGLTAQGTEPEEGYYLSDLIRYILQTYYPQIKWAGTANTFPVTQATWHDNPTSGYDIISALNELALWETNVWEGPRFTYESADLTTYDWIVRTDQPGVTVDFQGDSVEDFANGIVVSFEDFTGKKQVLYPESYPELLDLTETNPANQRGLKLWTSTDVPWQCLEAEAIQFGRIKLAEFNRPKRTGSITVQGHIQDSAGRWHPAWKVRSSDSIGVMDHPSDEPRLIYATSYDDDSKTVTISVDGLPQDLDAVVARHEVAFQARNL
jgi:hypothetical protein